jgi:alkylhydroperoxidase family enzyme
MLGHKPEVLHTFAAFYQAIWAPGTLSPKLRELAYLRTSILNGCAY